MIRTPTIANALRRTVLLPPFWLLIAVVIFLDVFHPSDTSVQAGPNSPANQGVAFGPTVPNTQPPQGKYPQGWFGFPAANFRWAHKILHEMDMVGMQATTDSRPIHRVYVDGFFMDKTDVTNAQFAEFVKATGYVTVAEKAPTAEEFPGAPPENLYAGGVVFSPPNHAVPLNDHFQWWSYVKGANWRHPTGPKSSIRGKENYPVVQVAYQDAEAYAKWAHKRLPTEAEWEFAARGGLAGKPFVWGDEFRPNGKWMANTYQGHFPNQDSGSDGFVGLAPVAQYPPNGYGLFDMAGNVWQWTSDWYRPDYYAQLAKYGRSGTQSKRSGYSVRPGRTLRKKESPSRRIFSLHGSILLSLYGGNTREGRSQYRNKSSGFSLCLNRWRKVAIRELRLWRLIPIAKGNQLLDSR